MAIIDDLATMRLPNPEITDWFRTTLRAAFTDITSVQQRQRQALLKRRTELANMKDRLLTAYLAGTIDKGTLQCKTTDLTGQLREVERSLEGCGDIDPARGDTALAVFDWSQKAVHTWRRSKIAQKRAILDAVSLNRTLSDTTLCVEKRKPFSFLAERLSFQLNRGDCPNFEPSEATRPYVITFLRPPEPYIVRIGSILRRSA